MTLAFNEGHAHRSAKRNPPAKAKPPANGRRKADSKPEPKIAEVVGQWPLPLHKQDYASEPEPMARGEWPSFCAKALHLAELDAKRRKNPFGRNQRIAAQMKVASTTIRRAVGSFPKIVAFADGSKTLARNIAQIPFASAVILANWANRDRKAALKALDECRRGMGTKALAMLEAQSRHDDDRAHA